jgi:hypothetical protein
MPLDLTRACSLEPSLRFSHPVAIFLILPSLLNLSLLNVGFIFISDSVYLLLCIKFTLACCEFQVQMISKLGERVVRKSESDFDFWISLLKKRILTLSLRNIEKEHPYSLQFQYRISYLDDQMLVSGTHYFGLFTCASNDCGGINMNVLETRQ